jgi:t-SNARE complex subunit (syntaxin)
MKNTNQKASVFEDVENDKDYAVKKSTAIVAKLMRNGFLKRFVIFLITYAIINCVYVIIICPVVFLGCFAGWFAVLFIVDAIKKLKEKRNVLNKI